MIYIYYKNIFVKDVEGCGVGCVEEVRKAQWMTSHLIVLVGVYIFICDVVFTFQPQFIYKHFKEIKNYKQWMGLCDNNNHKHSLACDSADRN